MLVDFPDADIVFVESGGDNLAATFSPDLSDPTTCVVINKIDLSPYVGADLGIMEADTRRLQRS